MEATNALLAEEDFEETLIAARAEARANAARAKANRPRASFSDLVGRSGNSDSSGSTAAPSRNGSGIISEDDEEQDAESDIEDYDNHSWIRAEYEGRPWYKRPNPVVIGVTVLFSMTGLACMVPMQTDIMLSLICRAHYAQAENPELAATAISIPTTGPLFPPLDPVCRNNVITAKVASYESTLLILTSLVSIIINPVIMVFSDRLGRKKMMIFVSLLSIMAPTIDLIFINYPGMLDYHFMLMKALFSTRVLASLMLAYAADCLEPSKRTLYLSLLQSVVFISIAVGPLTCSILVSRFGSYAAVSWTALACTVIASLSLQLTGESLSKKARRKSVSAHNSSTLKAKLRRRSSIGLGQTVKFHLTSLPILKPLTVLKFDHLRNNPVKRHNAYMLIAFQVCIMSIQLGVGVVLMPFLSNVFHWGVVEMGYVAATMSTAKTLSLLSILPLLIRWMHKRIYVSVKDIDQCEVVLMFLGMFGFLLEHVGMLTAQTGFWFCIALVWSCFAGMGLPAVKSALTKMSNKGQVGELFAAVDLVDTTVGLVVPPIQAFVFNTTMDRGFPRGFLVTIIFVELIGVAVVYFMKPSKSRDDDLKTIEAEEAASASSSRRPSRVGSYGTMG